MPLDPTIGNLDAHSERVHETTPPPTSADFHDYSSAKNQVGREVLSGEDITDVEHKLSLIRDLINNPGDAALIEWASKKQGFKSLRDMEVTLDIDPGKIEGFPHDRDDTKKSILDRFVDRFPGLPKKRFWKERAQDATRSAKMTAAVTAGMSIAAGIGIIAAPISLPTILGAYAGSQIAKAGMSYFARERKIYQSKSSTEPSIAMKAGMAFGTRVKQAIDIGKIVVDRHENYDDEMADPAKRETIIGEAFNQIVKTLQEEGLAEMDEFWKAERRAKLLEAGAGLAGGIAGGLAGAHFFGADSVLQHAAKHGVYMHDGQVVPEGTPGAHFVERLEGAKDAWNFQVGHGDATTALKGELLRPDYTGFIENTADKGHVLFPTAQEITHQLIKDYPQQVFHALGGDPSAAIRASADKVLAPEWMMSVAALLGVDMNHLRKNLTDKWRSQRQGQKLHDRAYDSSFGSKKPDTGPSGPEEALKQEFRELVKESGKVFRRRYLAEPDKKVEQYEYFFNVGTKEAGISDVHIKRLDRGGEFAGAYPAGDLEDINEMAAAYARKEIVFLEKRIDIKPNAATELAAGRDVVDNATEWHDFVINLASSRHQYRVDFEAAHTGFVTEMNDMKTDLTDWPNPTENRGYVLYTKAGNPKDLHHTLGSIYKHEEDPNHPFPDGVDTKIVVAVDAATFADPAKRAAVQAEYESQLAVPPVPIPGATPPPYKQPGNVVIVPQGEEWLGYAQAVTESDALYGWNKYVRFLEVTSAWGAKQRIDITADPKGPGAATGAPTGPGAGPTAPPPPGGPSATPPPPGGGPTGPGAGPTAPPTGPGAGPTAPPPPGGPSATPPPPGGGPTGPGAGPTAPPTGPGAGPTAPPPPGGPSATPPPPGGGPTGPGAGPTAPPTGPGAGPTAPPPPGGPSATPPPPGGGPTGPGAGPTAPPTGPGAGPTAPPPPGGPSATPPPPGGGPTGPGAGPTAPPTGPGAGPTAPPPPGGPSATPPPPGGGPTGPGAGPTAPPTGPGAGPTAPPPPGGPSATPPPPGGGPTWDRGPHFGFNIADNVTKFAQNIMGLADDKAIEAYLLDKNNLYRLINIDPTKATPDEAVRNARIALRHLDSMSVAAQGLPADDPLKRFVNETHRIFVNKKYANSRFKDTVYSDLFP